MRILGLLVSLMGMAGVVVGSSVASIVWLVKLNLEGRLRDLVAVPDSGLQLAISLTESVADGFTEMAGQVEAVRVAADQLAALPEPGPEAASEVASAELASAELASAELASAELAAAELAAAEFASAELAATVATFVAGPYATLREVYGRVRTRAIDLGDAITGLGRSVPVGPVATAVIERLTAIDDRLREVDASVTELSALDAAGLAKPGVAATVSEQAAGAQATLASVDALIADLGQWLEELRQRLAQQDRRIARALTLGTLAASLMGLFFAGLNVLLFQQGRRWSGRR